MDPDAVNAAGVSFVFSEPIRTDEVQVQVLSGEEILNWQAIWSDQNTRLTLVPTAGSEVLPGTVYQVILTQVRDQVGNQAGEISIEFETLAALLGDVNADEIVDVRDAILTLRIAAELPLATAPAGHIEPTPYERQVADVNEDGSIDEGDALLIVQSALDRLTAKPVLAAGHGPVRLRWGAMAQEGKVLKVPVVVGGREDLYAGNVQVRYNPAVLAPLEVQASTGNTLMAVNTRTEGQIQVSLLNPDGLVGAAGEVLYLHFEVNEDLRDQGRILLEQVRFFDSRAFRVEVDDLGLEAELRLVPSSYGLSQNFPNPFNPSTEIRYQLPESGVVRLVVYDLLGRTVRVLMEGPAEAGHHVITWDGLDDLGRPAASGMYLLRLEAGNFAPVRKMMLMR